MKIFLSFVALLMSLSSYSQSNTTLFDGTFYYYYEDTEFVLELEQINNRVQGSHTCSMYDGSKIDSSDGEISIYGQIYSFHPNGKHILVLRLEFHSSFSDEVGYAVLEYSDGKFIWKDTSSDEVEHFLPEKVEMKKIEE